MATLMTIVTSPAAAAAVTAAALFLQGWWQRRAAVQQRQDDHAHQLAMAKEQHRANLERIEREAALRVREAGHERLLNVHQALLARLDALAMAASAAITSMHRLGPDDQVQLGMQGLNISQDYGPLMDAERAVRLFASSDAVEAARMVTTAASALMQSGLLAESPPGLTLAQYSEHFRRFHDAREGYRAALRRDIGSE